MSPAHHLQPALVAASIANGTTFGHTRVSIIALAVLGAIVLFVTIISLIAQIKIISKAGYSGWWILVSFVPLLNIIMFFVFAFSEWPVRRELRLARTSMPTVYPGASGYPGAGGYPGASGYPGAGGYPVGK